MCRVSSKDEHVMTAGQRGELGAVVGPRGDGLIGRSRRTCDGQAVCLLAFLHFPLSLLCKISISGQDASDRLTG